MFLLVPAHPGSPGQRAIKRLLVLYTYMSRLTRLTGGGLLSRFGSETSLSRRLRSLSWSRLSLPAAFDLLQYQMQHANLAL